MKTSFIILIIAFFIDHSAAVMSSPAEDNVIRVPLWSHESRKAPDLEDLELEFSKVDVISLKQSWLPASESGFNPTSVKVVWEPEGLYVFALLQDEDIGSRSTHFNQRLWELGDTFETFIYLKGADAYYEFHVSPNNHVMQLCFDVDLTPAQRRLQLPHLFMPRQVIESKVWVETTKNQWHVLLMIPASVLKPSGTFVTGDTLEFSFSRYDCSRHSEEPILSSSSDHAELDFHRRQDWGTLCLKGSAIRKQ